jgi:hypothetical protein
MAGIEARLSAEAWARVRFTRKPLLEEILVAVAASHPARRRPNPRERKR